MENTKTAQNIALVVETTLPPVSRANLRLYNLGISLSKRGYSVDLFCPSQMPLGRKTIKFKGMDVHQFPGFGAFIYSRARLLVRFYHLVCCISYLVFMDHKKHYSVIHAWNPLAGLAAVVAGKLTSTPVYIDFTDFYSDIAATDSPATAPIFRSIERYVLGSARKIIVVSDVMVERLVSQGIDPKRIFIIEDGTDGAMFNPSADGSRVRARYSLGSSPTLIYHGDIKPPDGVDVLLKAFAKVLESAPDAKLLVVGGGSGYFDGLRSSVSGLGIKDSVIFTGWVPHSEVPEYIAASDFGAMPMRSTLNHNCYLSFKLFEYWGVGKPVVTSRLTAISKIVKDNVNGLTVEAEDVDGLAEAFLYLIKNSAQAKAMGANGRELINTRFDWNVIMEKEADLYEAPK